MWTDILLCELAWLEIISVLIKRGRILGHVTLLCAENVSWATLLVTVCVWIIKLGTNTYVFEIYYIYQCLRWGSYMSAHVLLNLFNELRKRDKMRGPPSILSLFRNEFNKFNNTGARMLDSIYNMTLKLFWNHILAWKR